MHRSKYRRYSITSSARTSNDLGRMMLISSCRLEVHDHLELGRSPQCEVLPTIFLSGRPLRIIDHVLQLSGARFVHLDPALVPIDAKTRSAFRLLGVDATGGLAPDQPRSLRLGHQSMQIKFVLAVALGQHAQPSRNLRLGLLEFLAPAGRERWILLDVLGGVPPQRRATSELRTKSGTPRGSCLKL